MVCGKIATRPPALFRCGVVFHPPLPHPFRHSCGVLHSAFLCKPCFGLPGAETARTLTFPLIPPFSAALETWTSCSIASPSHLTFPDAQVLPPGPSLRLLSRSGATEPITRDSRIRVAVPWIRGLQSNWLIEVAEAFVHRDSYCGLIRAVAGVPSPGH